MCTQFIDCQRGAAAHGAVLLAGDVWAGVAARLSVDVMSIDAAGEQVLTGDAAVTFGMSEIAASGAVAVRGPASIAPPVSAIAASGIAPIGAGPASVVLPV